MCLLLAAERVFVLVCGGLTTESVDAQSEPTPTGSVYTSYQPVSYQRVTTYDIRLSGFVGGFGFAWVVGLGLVFSIRFCAAFLVACFLFVVGVVFWCCSVGE
jgi:hypothetical protein